jgi:DUF3011 family protein
MDRLHSHHYTQRSVTFLIGAAVAAATLCIPGTATAQPQEPEEHITCASLDGQRAFCEADTREGARLVREVSYARCQQGVSWGYTDRGVWVDRGCRAEFVVFGYHPRPRVIDAGTTLVVRTEETIQVRRRDARVFRGLVEEDVRDERGAVTIVRGSPVELIVRAAPDNDLILDLESVTVNGERYAIDTDTERIDAPDSDRHTGEYVGGGAILGSIIGAIAGGGKGAAIGAAAGAVAGASASVSTRGQMVRVPAESLLTFRLDRPLIISAFDRGRMINGRHYHDYRR